MGERSWSGSAPYLVVWTARSPKNTSGCSFPEVTFGGSFPKSRDLLRWAQRIDSYTAYGIYERASRRRRRTLFAFAVSSLWFLTVFWAAQRRSQCDECWEPLPAGVRMYWCDHTVCCDACVMDVAVARCPLGHKLSWEPNQCAEEECDECGSRVVLGNTVYWCEVCEVCREMATDTRAASSVRIRQQSHVCRTQVCT